MTLLGDATFRRLGAAFTLANLGDSTLFLALAIWARDLTGSDAAAGLVFLFFGLPSLAAPLTGQLVDRTSRRRLSIVANLLAAVGVLSLGLVRDAGDLWLLYAVSLGYGLLANANGAAGSAMVRDLLDDDRLAEGNGIIQTIDQGLRLVSPLLGAGVYAAFGGFAIAVTTAIALVGAAAVMATVHLVESEPEGDRERFWTEATAGFRHIAAVPLLARVTLALAAAFAVSGLANTTTFAVIDQGLGREATFFGVLAAVQGAGSIVGGVTSGVVVRRLGEADAVALALALLAGGMVAMLVPDALAVLLAAAVVGLAIPWLAVGFVTLRQRVTPARLQGRVGSASIAALNGPQALGTLAGAALITVVDYRALVVTMAVVVAACAIPIVGRRTDPEVRS